MDSGYFRKKFDEIKSIENNRERGQQFDYFAGLLFNQLPDVKVAVGKTVATGEIDVFVSCLNAPHWLHRLVGDATLIENKWRKSPTQTKDISVFHDKVAMATVTCKVCYFISLGGFTSKGEVSATQLMRQKSNPKMVGFSRQELEEMINDGSPEKVLRGHLM